MLALLWRPVLGLVGLLIAGVSGYALTRVEINPMGADLLMVGGWIMIGLLAVACVFLLISGFATAVMHIQDRGHGAPPTSDA